MTLPLARAGALLFAALLALGAAQGAEAQTFVGGTNVWTMVGPPSFNTNGGEPVGVATWSNHLGINFNVTGIVMMVIRNSSGQTLLYTTATLTVESGAVGTSEDVVFGLAPGTYSATFFAFTFGGVAISNATTITYVYALGKRTKVEHPEPRCSSRRQHPVRSRSQHLWRDLLRDHLWWSRNPIRGPSSPLSDLSKHPDLGKG